MSECRDHRDALECAHRDDYAAAIRRSGGGYKVEVTDRLGEMILPGTSSLERARTALKVWMTSSAVVWDCQDGT